MTIELGDIVISDDVTYHDMRPIQMKNCFPFKQYFNADEKLKEIAVSAYKNSNLNSYNFHIGRIVTGDAFIADTDLNRI